MPQVRQICFLAPDADQLASRLRLWAFSSDSVTLVFEDVFETTVVDEEAMRED